MSNEIDIVKLLSRYQEYKARLVLSIRCAPVEVSRAAPDHTVLLGTLGL